MLSLRDSLAGPGYVILNAIRVMNIIALLDIIAASVVMLVKISTVNAFFFFEAVTHAVTIVISIFLIVSELPIFTRYFDRNWPLLGQESGFVALAAVMMILGVVVLGDLNRPSESLGLAFWRIIVSAGILALVMSAINLASSFIFADRSAGVSARHVRIYGAVAPQKVITRSDSYRSFQLSVKREDSLPTYNDSSYSSVRRPMSIRSGTRIARLPLKISSPDEAKSDTSSKYSKDDGVTVPNLAHHPAMCSGHI
ncbi:hypothetical protein MPDQ_007821 [Monascus purpureus]|uniref:DUF7598 domain-containing protein n=1 Tax=Monascus purpureus TaxID=5098 RepID=A0A507QT17_MONPU|nr:hypothetical protein MPDQ_007821 [Monascus purpureus]BDD61150.1 hypothetical protein MAP00_006221 [Monascus purpureus]